MEIPLKLLINYVRRRQEDLITCETALKENNFQIIQMIGHQLKGSAGSFGHEAMGEIGTQIESAAEEKNAEKLVDLLSQLTLQVNQIALK